MFFSIESISGGCKYALEVTWREKGEVVPQSQLADLQITDNEYEPNRGNGMKIWIVFQGMSARALETDSKT